MRRRSWAAGRRPAGRRRSRRHRLRRQEFLVTTRRESADSRASPTLNLKEWKAGWGAADPQDARGALTAPLPVPPAREVYLLQRSKGPQGRRLGKTSGWVHRASLKATKVQQLSGVNYECIDDAGLHISFGANRSGRRVLEVENVVICARLQPFRERACRANDTPWQLAVDVRSRGGPKSATGLSAPAPGRSGPGC